MVAYLLLLFLAGSCAGATLNAPLALSSSSLSNELLEVLTQVEVKILSDYPEEKFIFVPNEVASLLRQLKTFFDEDTKQEIVLFRYLENVARVVPANLLRIHLEKIQSSLLQLDAQVPVDLVVQMAAVQTVRTGLGLGRETRAAREKFAVVVRVQRAQS